MKPTISEFSYGFALTNELVGWGDLAAAPVFPSLIEEGQAGGGYDVKLDRPGLPLFLQFKRSDFMTRRSAREYRAVTRQGGTLAVPYYRFAVTEEVVSRQHEMLLDVAPNFVFYAAPRFHRIEEINAAWSANAVASRSQFVAPQAIGPLSPGPHAVAFDGARVWTCSDPREVQGLSSRELVEKLRGALKNDDRSLRDRLPEVTRELAAAAARGRSRIEDIERSVAAQAAANKARRKAARLQEMVVSGDDLPRFAPSVAREARTYVEDRLADAALDAPDPPAVEVRTPKPLSPAYRLLRDAADSAARTFDAQLVIVQPTD
ncbi:hypothetical protein [Brevundimonas sp.]|uniref:hypothetical protein n=1 Tax=Brevundimonas sp. TaxID=1871086 RepID=UPI00356984DC